MLFMKEWHVRYRRLNHGRETGQTTRGFDTKDEAHEFIALLEAREQLMLGPESYYFDIRLTRVETLQRFTELLKIERF